jgi:thiol-disulfide isomerase/thioredoxin
MAIVGNPAPPYGAITLAGDSVELSHLIGRPVLLNIWATWCKPCREEMPSLERLGQHFDGATFALVTVNVDAPPEGFFRENYGARTVDTFMKAYDLDLPVWLDPSNRVKRVFRTMGLPTTVLIRPDGTVDNIVVGGVDWDDEFYRGLVLEIIGPEIVNDHPGQPPRPDLVYEK